MNFNAYDQIPAILDAFKDRQVRTFPDSEGEELIHIAFANPYTGNDDDMEIYVTSSSEFIVFFAGNHCHYYTSEWESEEEACSNMIKLIRDILDNRICGASLQPGVQATDRHRLGSTFLSKDDLHSPIEKVFDFVLRHKEFSDRINRDGGIVHYVFWNPAFNKQIELGKQTIKQQRA